MPEALSIESEIRAVLDTGWVDWVALLRGSVPRGPVARDDFSRLGLLRRAIDSNPPTRPGKGSFTRDAVRRPPSVATFDKVPAPEETETALRCSRDMQRLTIPHEWSVTDAI